MVRIKPSPVNWNSGHNCVKINCAPHFGWKSTPSNWMAVIGWFARSALVNRLLRGARICKFQQHFVSMQIHCCANCQSISCISSCSAFNAEMNFPQVSPSTTNPPQFDCKAWMNYVYSSTLTLVKYISAICRLFWGLATHYLNNDSTKWSVHQDGCIELSRGASNAHRSHLVESPQWVAPWEQLCHISLFQGPNDQHYDVVNHVAVAMATQIAE